MIFESCAEIRSYFSDYLDGACETREVHAIRYHLANCMACSRDLERYRSLRMELHGLARRQVSSDLALRLRVQVSHELHRNVTQRFMTRLQNMFRPVLLPSIAGLLVALACIGLVLGANAPRSSNIPDVPLQIVTPPRIRELAPMDFDMGSRPLLLETYVNARGEVTSYKVLSGPHSPKLMKHLDRMMYFSLFCPATAFGVPTNGHLLLSFRQITVRG
ncbi:MAG: anti-sigma factor [Acidobacteria bacterium]|nr:anti-sigma factor [Acidobacteriota bacterium]